MIHDVFLHQVPVNPSLYLIKYDGFDCVYGLELHKDERVQGLEVLPDRLGKERSFPRPTLAARLFPNVASVADVVISGLWCPWQRELFISLAKSRLTDVSLADTMIGKAVEHMFETEEGPKEEWRGMVLARAPIMTTWFYITYEKDPVLYMYQLLDDYKEGDLRIMPDSSEYWKSSSFDLSDQLLPHRSPICWLVPAGGHPLSVGRTDSDPDSVGSWSCSSEVNRNREDVRVRDRFI